MLFEQRIDRSRSGRRLETQFKWWIEKGCCLVGIGSPFDAGTRDEEIVPKDRHVPRVSALLWTRAVRRFKSIVTLNQLAAESFPDEFSTTKLLPGQDKPKPSGPISTSASFLLSLVGLGCQKLCYLRFCNLEGAQKGRPARSAHISYSATERLPLRIELVHRYTSMGLKGDSVNGADL